MTSEIKVDTISENTSANGVTIDGLTIKDGNIIGDVALAGTTPTFTIGDAGTEDAALIFDGNAQDFYVALDDSADDLVIGLGNTIGTTPIMSFDENKDVVIHDGGLSITTADNTDTLSLISTDADGSSGPNLRMYRNSGSPADGDDLGKLEFEGRNDNSQDVVFGRIRTQIRDASDGTEDGKMDLGAILAGTEIDWLTFDPADPASVIINESSKDIDFRVESNGNANMLHVNGGSNLVGIGADPDLGVGLHIKSADSGASVAADCDELVIENSANAGISILTGTGNNGRISFGDSGGNQQGQVKYEHSTNDMIFNTDSGETFRLHSNGSLSNGGETAPDTAVGLCLNQAGNDGAILTFKNSDVSHPYTGIAEADTYARFSKNSVNNGGLFVQGYSDSSATSIQMRACGTDGDQTKSGAATGYFTIEAAKTDGSTSVGSPGSNENLVTIRSGTDDCVFIFDEEGDFHADNSSTTFDAFDDAQLVRAYDLSHGKGVINSKFDKFIAYNHEKLAELKLVGREKDGTPNSHVNITGMQRLHNGAIWQQYEKTERLANAMYELAKAAVGEEKANEILEQNEIKLLN